GPPRDGGVISRALMGLAIVLGCQMGDVALAADQSWAGLLGAPEGEIPATQPYGRWRRDGGDAMKFAQAENRPLFVTMRCLPCKQCSAFFFFELEAAYEISPLLKQFVTVRLTDAQAIDLRMFPIEGFQDFDLSWWGWFLSPEG